jgi:putative holliday junction resolvase
MGRILAIDYGTKRIGLAWTDPQRIIATSLPPCLQSEIMHRIRDLTTESTVDLFLVGMPKRFDNSPTHATAEVIAFIAQLQQLFQPIPVLEWDERFTSKMAKQTLIDAGANRKQRQDKALVNSIAATILLQDYLSTC